ncbi:MAG: acyltransferase [Eubacteriales bacterium]|nr:acyltransferase [Eubacteriales bacterium]
MNRKPEKKRIRIFDYLKAAAVIFVIINHYIHSSWEVYNNSIFFPLTFKMPVPIFMIVTGCVLAMSQVKKPDNTLYNPKELTKKILRFWIPFFFAYVVEVLLFILIYNRKYTVLDIVNNFLRGGAGLNGSYYVPVMIQLVFIFPVLYLLIKKYKTNGLIVCLAINFLYELICTLTHIPYDIYRILMPRYIAYVALGCWFYFKDFQISKKLCAVMFSLGLGFIVIKHLGYKPYVFKMWADTCMLVAMYIFPIVACIIMKYKDYSSDGVISRVTTSIGNASYHIFLVQMIYYNIFYPYVLKAFNTPIINIPLNIVICCAVGMGFYRIEKGISKRIISLI